MILEELCQGRTRGFQGFVRLTCSSRAPWPTNVANSAASAASARVEDKSNGVNATLETGAIENTPDPCRIAPTELAGVFRS